MTAPRTDDAFVLNHAAAESCGAGARLPIRLDRGQNQSHLQIDFRQSL
jgi:hypothetical protein